MNNFLTKYKIIILLGCIVFSFTFLTRIINIESIPTNINPDAADTLQRYLLLKYHHLPFTFFGFNWNGAPAFNTYVIGFLWELFGKSIFGLRFASVLFSSLTVTFSFLLFHLLTKRRALSFLVALSLSANPLFLNFSRDGWENIFNALFLNLLIIGVIFYFDKKKYLTGLTFMIIGSVLGFYGYHPGKFFIIPPLLLLTAEAFIRTNFKKTLSSIAILSCAFLILTFPQIFSTIDHKDMAFGRIANVSVFDGKSPLEEIEKNIANTIKGFVFFDGKSFATNGNYNHRYLPVDYPPIQVLFLPFYFVGLAISFKKYPHLLFTFLVVLFPVQIFSHGAPDGSRGVHVIPFIYLFILLGFNYVLGLKEKKSINKGAPLGIFALIILVFLLDIYTYYSWIGKESTLAGRRPAVPNDQYVLWISTLENKIQNGQWGFTVSEWNLMAKSVKMEAALSSKTNELKSGK